MGSNNRASFEHPHSREPTLDPEPIGQLTYRLLGFIEDNQGVRVPHGVDRLTQASGWHGERLGEVGGTGHQEVDVTPKLQVLKAIVEQVHGRPIATFGQASGQMAARRDEHRHAFERLGQHERLIASPRKVRPNPPGLPDDDDAVSCITTTVPTTQDRGPLVHLEEESSQVLDQGRFATTSHGQVPDADHRAGEFTSRFGMVSVPLASPPGKRSVESSGQSPPRSGQRPRGAPGFGRRRDSGASAV